MFIPAAIGLIISTIFLNFSFLAGGASSLPSQNGSVKIDQVLGTSKKLSFQKILLEQEKTFDEAIIKVAEGAGFLSMPKLFQSSPSGQLSGQLPSGQENLPVSEPGSAIADYNFLAKNGLILDCNDDSLFFAKRPDQPWPIASITKLFTAYTFLDYNPGWDTSYKIRAEDKRQGGKIYLFTGDIVTVKDLFYFSLVGSDNTATAALVNSTGLSEKEFIEKMNAKVKELGLKNTSLVDPAGLEDGNISTAREVALFAKVALANEEISRASLTKTYKFNTKQGRKKIITSTNELLNSFPEQGISILGGKTGHVDSSGYCLVGQFKNFDGQAIVTVVLGADSDSSRFSLTKELVDLYYKNKP